MQIKCLAIDDEPLSLKQIAEYVRIFLLDEKPIMSFFTVKSLEKKLPTERFM